MSPIMKVYMELLLHTSHHAVTHMWSEKERADLLWAGLILHFSGH